MTQQSNNDCKPYTIATAHIDSNCDNELTLTLVVACLPEE